MTISVWSKAAVLWGTILVFAILNGALREKLLIPTLGSPVGLPLSGIVLSICIFFVAYATAPWYGPIDSRQRLIIGIFWLILTLVFEFSFGRFVQHKSWLELFGAYSFKGGNIWPLVLITTLISPWLTARIRHLI